MRDPKFKIGEKVFARRTNGSIVGPLPIESVDVEISFGGRLDWYFLSECWEDKSEMVFAEMDCFLTKEEAVDVTAHTDYIEVDDDEA